MGTLADRVEVAIAEPVLSAGVFRTPVLIGRGYGAGALVAMGVGWVWRRWRSTLPNYVVLACTASDLLVFDVGRRIDETAVSSDAFPSRLSARVPIVESERISSSSSMARPWAG